jgi:FkbM family methyltransferase
VAQDALVKLSRRYRIRPRGVIHVGAHHGEEHRTYNAIGAANQFWVEPHPDAFERLTRNAPPSPTVHHANAACGSRRATLPLNVIPTGSKDEASVLMSSLLAPGDGLTAAGRAAVAETIDVPVAPLDELLADHALEPDRFDLLVLDTQGYELEVLKGATHFLDHHAEFIYTEVSRTPLYQGSCLERDLDAFLAPRGFRRLYTRLSRDQHGNALYARSNRLSPLRAARLTLLGPKTRTSKKRRT